MRISNDQFHNATEYEQAYTFYKPLVDEANTRIRSKTEIGGILLEYTDKMGDVVKQSLLYEGRAIGFIDEENSQYQHGGNVAYPLLYKHRIKIINNTIPCALMLLANGGVTFFESLSYKNFDAMSFGNIASSHLSEIIDRFNQNCMLLCSEAEKLRILDTASLATKNMGIYNFLKFNSQVCNEILRLRHDARRMFDNLSAQDIISKLPFPTFYVAFEIAWALYEQCPEYSPDMLIEMGEVYKTPSVAACIDEVSEVVLNNLDSLSVPRKYTRMKLIAFDAMEFLNEMCAETSHRITDDTNFPCDLDFSNDVDYTEDFSTDVFDYATALINGLTERFSQ